MTDYLYDSNQNGGIVHWFNNDTERCHPAIIAGNFTCTGVDPTTVTADIIQQDALVADVIILVRHDGLDWDDTATPANNTWHWMVSCPRQPVIL